MSTDTLTQPAPDPTLDSLQQFLDGIAKTPLLTADEEISLAKRIERGDLVAKDHMTRANLRLVVSIAKRYRNQGLPVPGSDPGGHDRARPRGREVRLPQGLQVLDLRDLVDPPGDLPCDRRQGPDHPDPDPHRQHPQEARRRPAQAGGPGRPRDHDRGDRRHGRGRPGRGRRDHARRAAARVARQAGGRRLGRRAVRRPDPGRVGGVAVRPGGRVDARRAPPGLPREPSLPRQAHHRAALRARTASSRRRSTRSRSCSSSRASAPARSRRPRCASSAPSPRRRRSAKPRRRRPGGSRCAAMP